MNITYPYNYSCGSKTKVNDSDQSITMPKKFSAIVIDDNNIKWFLTELGIITYDGEKWKLLNDGNKVNPDIIRGFGLESTPDNTVVWIGTVNGVTVASLSHNSLEGITTYISENSSLASSNVLQVAIGKSPVRWFGTDKGVSGLINDKWLIPDYEVLYPERMFADFPIISMAASIRGDSLYVGTAGAGVTRVYRNDVDGISGASSYGKWASIIMPSNYVCSIYIAPDGTQWFGTDKGIARHAGSKTLENWSVYTTDEGLVDNFVQAITGDKDGNLWFGTKNGISVFDGSDWTAYTKDNGLSSNNILCLGSDSDGIIWIGTSDGVNCFKNGEFISFK